MKFYLISYKNNATKEITKDEALKLINIKQLETAQKNHLADPYEEQSYMTKDGFLVIDF